MFTLQRLQIPESLHKCLATTNIMGSPQTGVERRAHNVTRWRGGGDGATLGGFRLAANREALPTDRWPRPSLGASGHPRAGEQVNHATIKGESSVGRFSRPLLAFNYGPYALPAAWQNGRPLLRGPVGRPGQKPMQTLTRIVRARVGCTRSAAEARSYRTTQMAAGPRKSPRTSHRVTSKPPNDKPPLSTLTRTLYRRA